MYKMLNKLIAVTPGEIGFAQESLDFVMQYTEESSAFLKGLGTLDKKSLISWGNSILAYPDFSAKEVMSILCLSEGLPVALVHDQTTELTHLDKRNKIKNQAIQAVLDVLQDHDFRKLDAVIKQLKKLNVAIYPKKDELLAILSKFRATSEDSYRQVYQAQESVAVMMQYAEDSGVFLKKVGTLNKEALIEWGSKLLAYPNFSAQNVGTALCLGEVVSEAEVQRTVSELTHLEVRNKIKKQAIQAILDVLQGKGLRGLDQAITQLDSLTVEVYPKKDELMRILVSFKDTYTVPSIQYSRPRSTSSGTESTESIHSSEPSIDDLPAPKKKPFYKRVWKEVSESLFQSSQDRLRRKYVPDILSPPEETKLSRD